MCKCGKANQPTRKYCIRCGASLIEIENSSEGPVVERIPRSTEHKSNAPPVSEKTPITTTGDKWIRPSQVARDRIRTAERHIEKTEFEKAQEAFSKDESSEGDERLLRASEIRELMEEASSDSGPSRPIENVSPPLSKSMEPDTPAESLPTHATPPVMVRSASSLVEGEIVEQVPSEIDHEPPKKEVLETGVPKPPDMTHQVPDASTTPEESEEMDEIETPIPSAVDHAIPVPEPKPVTQSIEEDSKIRELDADIVHYQQQMKQLETEMESLKLEHVGERKWLSTVAETKRIHVVSLEADLKKAKSELSEAQKGLQIAEQRMKKELKESYKRIDAQEKRIDNAEKARKKRVKELEKD